MSKDLSLNDCKSAFIGKVQEFGKEWFDVICKERYEGGTFLAGLDNKETENLEDFIFRFDDLISAYLLKELGVNSND